MIYIITKTGNVVAIPSIILAMTGPSYANATIYINSPFAYSGAYPTDRTVVLKRDANLTLQASTTVVDTYMESGSSIVSGVGTTITIDSTVSINDGALLTGNGSFAFTGQEVNVKWFGAVGNGVVNDTGAIQKAVDSGDNVFIPPGTYLCNISLPANTILSGANRNTTTLKGMLSTSPVILIDASVASKDNIKISDIAIKGPATYGIRAYSASGGSTRHCDFLDIDRIRIDGGLTIAGLALESRCIWSSFNSMEILESTIGLFVEADGPVSQCTFSNSRFAWSTQWGVWFKSIASTHQVNKFDVCNIENNNASNNALYGGMYIEQVTGLIISNSYFENNGAAAKGNIFINTDKVCHEFNLDTCALWGSINALVASGAVAARLMTGSIKNIHLSGAGNDIIKLFNDHPSCDVSIGSIYPLNANTLQLSYGTNSGVASGYIDSVGNSVLIDPTSTPIATIDLRRNIQNVIILLHENSIVFTTGTPMFTNAKAGQMLSISVKRWGTVTGSTLTIAQNRLTASEPESSYGITGLTHGISLRGGTDVILGADSLVDYTMLFRSDGRNFVELSRSFT